MISNELTKLYQIEQLLSCILVLIQKQEKFQKCLGIVSQKELLKTLNISPNTLKKWENTGLKRLEPPIEYTRTVYYKIEDIINYLTL